MRLFTFTQEQYQAQAGRLQDLRAAYYEDAALMARMAAQQDMNRCRPFGGLGSAMAAQQALFQGVQAERPRKKVECKVVEPKQLGGDVR